MEGRAGDSTNRYAPLVHHHPAGPAFSAIQVTTPIRPELSTLSLAVVFVDRQRDFIVVDSTTGAASVFEGGEGGRPLGVVSLEPNTTTNKPGKQGYNITEGQLEEWRVPRITPDTGEVVVVVSRLITDRVIVAFSSTTSSHQVLRDIATITQTYLEAGSLARAIRASQGQSSVAAYETVS